MAVPSVLLPVLGGWLIQGALFSQAPPGRVPVLKQAISGFPVRRCRLLWFFSSLLRLVELKPADPLRTNTNLYRLEVTKMPSQMQSDSYTEISCRG